MPGMYVQTTGPLDASRGAPQPIPGLTLELSKGIGQALVILNVPNPGFTENPGEEGVGGLAFR